MENSPFEDVFPIEYGGFSNVMLVFREGKWQQQNGHVQIGLLILSGFER